MKHGKISINQSKTTQINRKKALSAGLFIAGLLLLYFGYQEYQSINSEVEEFFTGSPSSQAMWMLIGGAAAAIVGLIGLLKK